MKMLNILLSPGEVFDEITTAPPGFKTWLIPTLAVYFVALAVTQPAAMIQPATAAVAHEKMLISLDTGVSVFAGIMWSAFTIWLMGRICLKAHFSFMKALEVAALSGTVLMLGTILTCLLIAISGNPITRPSLSLLLNGSTSHPTLHAVLDALNIFHLWSAAVLGIGLSKLSGVSFRECAIWVFGYWILSRIVLILLA